MGKRNKSNVGGDLKANKKAKKIKIADNSDAKEPQHDQLNTPKIKNKKSTINEAAKCEPEEIIIPSRANRKKKNKLNKDDTANNKELSENVGDLQSNAELLEISTTNNKIKSNTNKNNSRSPHNKKIIFTDDEPVQVNNKKSQNKTIKNDLSQEEDVKDEDIDKFCEEIDEEDNEQYENWVKLIEAQLNSNKKKSK